MGVLIVSRKENLPRKSSLGGAGPPLGFPTAFPPGRERAPRRPSPGTPLLGSPGGPVPPTPLSRPPRRPPSGARQPGAWEGTARHWLVRGTERRDQLGPPDSGKPRPHRAPRAVQPVLPCPAPRGRRDVRRPRARVPQLRAAPAPAGATNALAFPDQLYDAVFDGAQVTSKTPIRLYGGALLSISLIMWNALYTAEKVIIRWTLLTEACYFSVQFLVVTATLAETGLVSQGILLLLASRLLFVAISVYYYYQVGRKPKKV
uniref:Tumor protein p53-inducible protein 11 n=1 Tax=Bos mutus grunniens TaxID=30521 RepID=A0A8C0AK37_BOSMU